MERKYIQITYFLPIDRCDAVYDPLGYCHNNVTLVLWNLLWFEWIDSVVNQGGTQFKKGLTAIISNKYIFGLNDMKFCIVRNE